MAHAARLTRYRAVVAYDGTAYYGYQRQGGGTPTVQGAIETAIAQVTGEPATVSAAGRTDTGVHATGQVIAFDVAWKHAPEALWRAINANLPHDIALLSLSMADPEFHPRYDARSRMYEYVLYVAPARQPLLDRYAWHVPVREPLDVNAMQAAAGVLVGTHDFAAFGQPPQGENTVREVHALGHRGTPGGQAGRASHPVYGRGQRLFVPDGAAVGGGTGPCGHGCTGHRRF